MNACRILIVEDEGLIAQDIASRLQALGHTVAGTASTAAEAIEGAGSADVVLMDIRLDGAADGIDAAARIRSRYHVPVIFLTAHADGSTLERAKKAGPYGYLVKPVASASLQTTIDVAVYKHGMERKLEESEAWLRATLDSATEAVIVADPLGTIRMLNPAAQKLFESAPATLAGSILGDPAAVAVLEDGPVAVAAKLGARDMEGCATPVKTAEGLIGIVITLRDVSLLRREQMRLRQMERLLATGRLAGAVAEDFANVIAVIRGQSEQLLSQFADYTPVRKALEEIQQAAVAADQIRRRLAAMAGGDPGHPEGFSLHGLLRRLNRLMQSVAGPDVAVGLRPASRTGKIHADAAQVEDLLMRMVLHAANTTPAGGRMLIETGDVDDYVSLSVTHGGPSVDANLPDLSLAGYVAVEDPRRMEAFFPRASDFLATGGSTATLLLIEPREQIRGRLHNFFEANGFNLLEANDDEQARTLLELQQVDLIIAGAGEPATKVQGGLGAENVPLLAVRPPFTEQALLDQVRSAIKPRSESDKPVCLPGDELTFSASSL